MQNNYKQTQELMDNVVEELNVYKDLIGPKDEKKQNLYDFIPGLDMQREAKNIDYHIQKLREGIFQVLFTGVFSSGKSTLLNALMSKELLLASISPETAVITKIIFDADELVKVIYKKSDKNGKRITEELSVEKFFEKFRVSQDNPDEFMNVDYVVLQQPQDGIGGKLVQLVDSPGTNNSRADDETAREFAEKASAIVFLINATAAFNYDEKEYIKTHFAHKHMKNLFFVINHIDGVNPDEVDDLKKNARAQLNDVFTDENGNFDEALFNGRVFYTNAYGSLMSRIGEKVKTPYGLVEVDDNLTGVPQFEDALGKYLTDGNRDKDALSAYLSQMSNIYTSAEENVSNRLQQLREGLEKAQENKIELERYIKKTENIIEGIKISCSTAVRNIILSAKNEYVSFVNRIDTNWESHFEEEKFDGFSYKDILYITTANIFKKNNPEKMEECQRRLAPVTDAFKSYFSSEMDTMKENIGSQVGSYINSLKKQLDNYQEQLETMDCPIDVSNIFGKLNRESIFPTIESEDSIELKGNIFQMVLGIIGRDPELIVKAQTGQLSNTEFIIESLKTNFVWDVIFGSIVGVEWLFILVKMLKAVFEAGSTSTETARSLLNGIHKGVVENLKNFEEEFIVGLEKNIEAPILLAGNEFANAFTDELNSYIKSLENVIVQLESDSSAEVHEKQRTDMLLDNMVNCFNRVSVLTGGKEYTSKEIIEFATKK